MSETLWQLVHYLHLLAMAFFVGGQMVVVAAVVPVERAEPARMRAIGRRFGVGSLIALLILAGTGTAMATHESYWSSGTLQLKLGFVGAVVALTTVHLIWPKHRLLQVGILVASLTIVWLGLQLAH